MWCCIATTMVHTMPNAAMTDTRPTATPMPPKNSATAARNWKNAGGGLSALSIQ